jgi:hypothetical protein
VSTRNIHAKRKKLPDPTGKARLTVFLPEVTVVLLTNALQSLAKRTGWLQLRKESYIFILA